MEGGQPCWCLFIIIYTPSAGAISTSETPRPICPLSCCSWWILQRLPMTTVKAHPPIRLIRTSPPPLCDCRCCRYKRSQVALDFSRRTYMRDSCSKRKTLTCTKVFLSPFGELRFRHNSPFGRRSVVIHQRMHVFSGANISGILQKFASPLHLLTL